MCTSEGLTFVIEGALSLSAVYALNRYPLLERWGNY